MNKTQEKWDAFYVNGDRPISPASVLADHQHLLPVSGNALDLACGLGANALLLAERGLDVSAWDISPIALSHLSALANTKQLTLATRQCDICPETLAGEQFDVIVISRFLDRSLSNAIMDALKDGGLLFYQTFFREKLDTGGPSNPDYLLNCGELLQLFSPLNLVFYREYARIGDLRHGDRNEASFIGQKLNL